MRRGKRYRSDDALRCTVCKKTLPPGAVARCPTHPKRNNTGKRRDYVEFMTMPVPQDGASYSEIAVAMGVTAERVRQIETVALRKLAQNAKSLMLFRGE
jgi:Sigma-70, region 4